MDSAKVYPSTNSGMNYKNTAVHWTSYVRELMMQWVFDNLRNKKLQGEVEIDESLFGRRCKYHRGARRGQKIWTLGMVERSTNRLFLFPVKNRNAVILIGLIKAHVEEESTIYTDSWMGYSKLNEEGFRHFSVCHKHTFRQKLLLLTPIKSNVLGLMQSSIFVKNGTDVFNFEGHLCEILFRNPCRTDNILASLIREIRQVYTLEGPPPTPTRGPIWKTLSLEVIEAMSMVMKEANDTEDSRQRNVKSGYATTGLITLSWCGGLCASATPRAVPAGASMLQKRRSRPHFCPKQYRIVVDSEWEEETVNATQSGPKKTSGRGRVIRPKKKKSFIEIPDDDSDFL